MSTADESVPPEVDTSKPSIARVYDVMLGGKDNFEVDRALFQKLVEITPELPDVARYNRQWLTRVVRWLSRDVGIDQFLDLGPGLPTADNTHEVAQRINPAATVVYVDNDPTVIAHGRALLEDNERTYFGAADFSHPDEVLSEPVVTEHLELDRPVALLHCMTLHHLSETDQVRRIMASYIAALASGSYIALTHGIRPEPDNEDANRLLRSAATYRSGASAGFTLRTPEEIRSLLFDMDLVEPGLVPVADWWPEGPRSAPAPPMVQHLAGVVARKP